MEILHSGSEQVSTDRRWSACLCLFILYPCTLGTCTSASTCPGSVQEAEHADFMQKNYQAHLYSEGTRDNDEHGEEFYANKSYSNDHNRERSRVGINPPTERHFEWPGSASDPQLFAETNDVACHCSSKSNETCGRCLQLGYARRSNVFEVRNLVMKTGKPVAVGQHASQMTRCGQLCQPTWSWGDSGEYNIWGENSSDDTMHYDLEEVCDHHKINNQPALVVNWRWPEVVFHYYMEIVFSTFLTLAHIAEIRDRPKERIAVYVSDGLVDSPFMPLWNVVAGHDGNPTSDMNGCYKQVFFGTMFKSLLSVCDEVAYDYVLSSWMSAYRLNVRAALLLSSQKKPTNRNGQKFLFVAHDRTPSWMKKIVWTSKGLEVHPVDFAAMPFHVQITTAGGANGLIGIAGSGLAQQMFMPVGSSVLQVSYLFPSGPGASDCGLMVRLGWQQEGCSRCYGNSALHFGNSLLNWRWCARNETEVFTNQEAQAVLRLLMNVTQKARATNTSRICTVVNDHSTLDGSWPRCDLLAVAPIIQPQRQIPAYGFVGEHYNLDYEYRQIATYCLNAAYCY